ncbi:hypothetical protein, partial [Microbacterium sp. MYb24]
PTKPPLPDAGTSITAELPERALLAQCGRTGGWSFFAEDGVLDPPGPHPRGVTETCRQRRENATLELLPALDETEDQT